jgi:hypothetical protein
MESGWVDVGPGTIDYLLGFVGGGLGRFGNNLASTITRGWNGQEWDINKTPIVRRFFGETGPQGSRQLYYDAREEVKAAYDRMQGYRKDKDFANAQRYRQEHQAEIEAYSTFEAVDKRRRQLDAQATSIKADKALTPVERDMKLKMIEEEELGLMMRARKRLDDARRRTGALPLAVGQ